MHFACYGSLGSDSVKCFGNKVLLADREVVRAAVRRLNELATNASAQTTPEVQDSADAARTASLWEARASAFKAMARWLSDKRLYGVNIDLASLPPEFEVVRLRSALTSSSTRNGVEATVPGGAFAWEDLLGDDIMERLMGPWNLAVSSANKKLWLEPRILQRPRATTVRSNLGRQYMRLNTDSQAEDTEAPLPPLDRVEDVQPIVTLNTLVTATSAADAISPLLATLKEGAEEHASQKLRLEQLDNAYLGNLARKLTRPPLQAAYLA